jgi:putative N6-adenine-specific DNA methylase
VRATTKRSRIYHTGAIEERVQLGIAQALRVPSPPIVDAGAEAIAIAARFHEDRVTLSLDTSFTPLHRRGYRLDARKAPLREDLAHALLLAAGYEPGMALLDPFCGSGTIAIEGAAIAASLPPGRLRPAPLQGTPLQHDAGWRALLASLPPGPPAALPNAPIAASDRDAGAITATRANAERAGVAAAIDATVAALTKQPWFAREGAAPARGLVATNPPFGLRVGGGDLANLYQTLGHRVKQLGPGWRLAILAHDPRLARRTGIPLRQVFASNHGGVQVTALVSET